MLGVLILMEGVHNP